MIWQVICVILTIVSIGSIAYAIKIKIDQKETRDRYAFAALAAIASIFTVAVFSITRSTTPWSATVSLLHFSAVIDKQPSTHTVTDTTLVAFLGVVAIYFIHQMFVNWNGPISAGHYERKRFNEDRGLIHEASLELRRIIAREPPPKPYSGPTGQKLNTALDAPTESLAWRDQARELMELSYPSIRINPEEDWYDEKSCWIGYYRRTHASVLIYCFSNTLSETMLKDCNNHVEAYINSRRDNEKAIEVYICQKAGSGQMQYHFGDIEVGLLTEKHLLDNLVNFEDYYRDIIDRVENQYLPDSKLTIKDVFTVPFIEAQEHQDKVLNFEEYLVKWANEISSRQLALLGEYGQGKSTGTLMFAYKIITGEISNVKKIPIILELRGRTPSTLQPIELLSVWASSYGLNPKSLMKLLTSGCLIMIFEGFDEMAHVGELEGRLDQFRSLWRFCYPNAKLLLTGRPNFFLDDMELKAALGISTPSAAGPYCTSIKLKPFNTSQIAESLRWADNSVMAGIVALSKSDAKFLEPF